MGSVLACYGLPPSHPQRGSNEVLLSHVLAFLSGLRRPSIVAGDLNDSHITSAALSMCTAIGVHDLTPNLPTTMKKDGQVAKSPPIDHVVVKKVALDLFGKVRIDYRMLFSDHFPLVFTQNLTLRRDMRVVWPSVLKNLLNPVHKIPWGYSSYTCVALLLRSLCVSRFLQRQICENRTSLVLLLGIT